MAIYRMYTGDDRHSHIEEQTFTTHPLLGEPRSPVHFQFHEVSPDFSNDWHPAPEQLCFVVLEGQIELGVRAGTTRLNRGDAAVVEDTSGSGHTMRVSSDTPAVTAVIRFAD